MRVARVALILLIAGCGFFSKKQNAYFSLDTLPGQTSAAPASSPAQTARVPVGIEGVELPPGLDRREIVLRGKDQRLEIRGTQIWAGPLEDMIIHTLAFDLANRLPEGSVVLPGQAKPTGMRSIYVVLEDLATGQDRVFVLDGRWTLAVPGQPERVQRERITIDLASLESAEIASGMSRALAQLADRIAAAL